MPSTVHHQVAASPRRAAAAPLLALALALGGCSALPRVGPDYTPAPAKAAAQWQAPLPHGGNRQSLADWWSQLDDPVLVELVNAAQEVSASVARSVASIAQARAALSAADAARLPALDITASNNRGTFTFGGPFGVRTQNQAALGASWEIDLFGGVARASEAARARYDARSAEWHDARVSVAAEVASSYLQLRGCEQQVDIARADLASRTDTATVTEKAAAAGFQAPGNASLARASAAEAASRLAAQRADCELQVKALVALTGIDEPALRGKLATGQARLPAPQVFAVSQVPAEVLGQRPDVAAAERELAAASADIGAREADRYPRLSLSGSIGPFQFRSGNLEVTGTNWSIGPTVSLPLFDGGKRAANVDAAKAAYTAAESAYRARARQAVREVEEALVRLNSTAEREQDAVRAATGYREALDAAQKRWQIGLGSLLELEESRRLSLNANAALATLRRDRAASWIALYRALGGGWQPTAAPIADARPR